MDLPEILSLISIIISCASVALIFVLLKKLPEKENNNVEGKLDTLKNDLLGEFSRNRTEEAARAKAQRDELSQKLNETQEKLNNLTERNNQIMQNISFEINRQLLKNHDELANTKQANVESIMKLTNEVTRQLGEIKENSALTSQAQNQRIEESLEKIRVSNEAKLDDMRNVVDEKLTNTLNQRLESSFKTVSEQLTNLHTALGEMNQISGGITEHVSTLNRVLTNVKTRGTWAEIQLGNILDQTIPGMYVQNYAPNPRSKDRVEFAIMIPSGQDHKEIIYLPVDSKFPMEDYRRLCEAQDNADKEAVDRARRALEDRVLAEARDITKYISEPKTTPFAIMYLATEGLYAEIVSSKNAIVDTIQNKYKVMVAGPTTITALLNSFSVGFKVVAVNNKAEEIRDILSAVKGQYEIFGGLLEKARKKINEAGKTIDEAHTRTTQIQKKLTKISDLELGNADEVLEIDSTLALDEFNDD